MYKIGFIGSGKMAGAIIKGLIKTSFAKPEELIATQAETEGIDEKSRELGIKIILDNKELAQNSEVIFIATKPNQAADVLEEIKPFITSDKLIASIAAGVTTEKLESHLPENTRVIRIMPNTPALVGEGMSGMVGGKYADKQDLDFIYKLLSTIGKCIIVDDEAQIDIVTAISGSGPAFYYKVINEIARAGEKLGLAKMALNREISMEELISNVATKGGCTRVGVDCMDEYNTEKLFYDVIKSTAEKACALGK